MFEGANLHFFPIEHCFFQSASRNRNVFARHAAVVGLLGSNVFPFGS